jgi:hypothetical protein
MRRRELEAARQIKDSPPFAGRCAPAEPIPLDGELAFLLGEDDDG